MYGIPDPYVVPFSPTVTVYTNGPLPTAGRPAELSGATVHEIVAGLPGYNWGATPRHPTGEEGTATVSLFDDEVGTLGTILQTDNEAPFWGLETNRLTAAGTSAVLVNEADTEDDVPYFLNNESISTVLDVGPTRGHTREVSLIRGLCGSIARAHVLKPTDYSAGEDGTQDRLYLRTKPDWDAGWYCACYLFTTDQTGAIVSYVMRRGQVTGEPTPRGKQYDIAFRFIEGAIHSHTVGETSQETTLQCYILVTKVEQERPVLASFLLLREQADAFFNEPLGPRGGALISSSAVADLNTRMMADPDITYEIKARDDAEWVYQINKLSRYTWASSGVYYQAVKVDCSLRAWSPGATIKIVYNDGTGLSLKPWYQNSIPAGNSFEYAASGTADQGPAPVITLRCRIQKTTIQTFLTLAISRDGSSGGTYDKLIGSVGAGLPQSYFSLGSVSGSPLNIAGNTLLMLELDQLLNPVNDYYFDLSKGISLKDFLTNEFLLSQVLLGSLQDGSIAVRSYVHEVAATVTLQPLNKAVLVGKRLAPIKRLDLYAGTRVLTLEPETHQGVRYLGTQNIRPSETQPLRVWREGSQHSALNLSVLDLEGLIRAFYRLLGGAPRIYPVEIAIEDYIADGIEFGDAVSWSDETVATPSGLGISGDFFVIQVELNYDKGVATLVLLQNTLLNASTTTTTGTVAPTLIHTDVTAVSSVSVDVEVERLDGVTFDPLTDFGGLYNEIFTNDSYLRIDNHAQAPLGALELVGSLEAYARIASITVGPPVVIRLEFDAEWIRDPIAAAIDLFVTGETRIHMPPRIPADVSLSGNLIEADALCGPTEQNFVNWQPFRPLNGNTHTWGS